MLYSLQTKFIQIYLLSQFYSYWCYFQTENIKVQISVVTVAKFHRILHPKSSTHLVKLFFGKILLIFALKNWFWIVKICDLNVLNQGRGSFEFKNQNSMKLYNGLWLVCSRVMTVVEFHSVSVEIQWIFSSKWTSSNDFLIP